MNIEYGTSVCCVAVTREAPQEVTMCQAGGWRKTKLDSCQGILPPPPPPPASSSRATPHTALYNTRPIIIMDNIEHYNYTGLLYARD